MGRLAPWAGFSETAEFLRVFQNEELRPAWWEQKLWRLYDSTAHALNVSMVPLIAYSGEQDKQIQAAQAMERAMKTEGLELAHIIGPKTGHRYEPFAKAEIDRRINAIVSRPRDRSPPAIRFITHTLRYNQMNWVTIDALEQHWEPARVEAECLTGSNHIQLSTTNVAGLTLTFGPGESRFDPRQRVVVDWNGIRLETERPASDRSWHASFHREASHLKLGRLFGAGLQKSPGLQGPIDDAFMDSFLMVLPSGVPMAGEKVTSWARGESGACHRTLAPAIPGHRPAETRPRGG